MAMGTNGRLSPQSAAIYVGGAIFMLALVVLSATYILAPEGRDVLGFVTPVLTAVGTVLGIIFLAAQQNQTKATVDAAVVKVDKTTAVVETAVVKVEQVQENLDAVHKMVNSTATKQEESAALDRQRLEDAQRMASDAAKLAATDAIAATLEATKLNTEAMERMIAVAVAAAFQAIPPAALPAPPHTHIPDKEE